MVCSWGLCSSSFPPSRLWSSRLDLSFCRRAPGLLFASGGVFLPSLPSGSVGSPGFPRLSVPLYSGGALPRVGLVLCLRVVSVWLRSSLPLLLLRCLSAWWWFFPLGGLLLYGCLGSLIQQWSTVVLCSVVCLPSSLPLHCRGSVFFLRLRFVLRLSPLVIFLSAFAMGSPWAGSSVGVGSSTRSERRLSLFCILSGWGHPLGQVVFPFTLDRDRRITLAFGFCPFRWGPRSGAFACPLFPWVGFIICLCAPLLFSVWLRSALWFSFSWLLSLP